MIKEPGRAHTVSVLVAVVIAWVLSSPQPFLAQRPYPPPRANQSPTRTQSPPIAGNASEDGRRNEAAETASILLRRRLAAELTEDFEKLRRINREKVTPLSSSTTFDYKELSEVAGEINNRAKRIKSNSPFLLKEKKSDKVSNDADAARLVTMIPELGRLIDSFLGSPVFQVTSPNDDELRSNAGRALEGIIRLSETINKIAKQLGRTSTQRA